MIRTVEKLLERNESKPLKGAELEKKLEEENYQQIGITPADKLGIHVDSEYGRTCEKKGLLLVDAARFDETVSFGESYSVYAKQTM